MTRDQRAVVAINLAVALGISLFWAAWFLAPSLARARAPAAPDYQIYLAFEQAFPLADACIVIAAAVGSLGLQRRRPWGKPLLWMANGAMIFLALMDLLYDLEHGMFLPLGAESVQAGLVVLFPLAAGIASSLLLWRSRGATEW